MGKLSRGGWPGRKIGSLSGTMDEEKDCENIVWKLMVEETNNICYAMILVATW